MYVNGKMIPVDSITRMEEGRDKRGWERVNPRIIYLLYCKKFCGCHNVPPPSTTIKKNAIS
jgi:hypothetical protein